VVLLAADGKQDMEIAAEIGIGDQSGQARMVRFTRSLQFGEVFRSKVRRLFRASSSFLRSRRYFESRIRLLLRPDRKSKKT
jgi:hypothetical protein